MTVILKRPGEEPKKIDIEDTLEAYRSIIGGSLEHLGFGNGIGMLFDEDGKFKDLSPNFFLFDDREAPIDVVVGNVLFVGEKGEEFVSLSDEEIEHILETFGAAR